MANPASYKDVLDQNRKEKESGNIATGGIDFDSEEERARYLVSVFPGLVKAGKFVEAMEIVHRNGSFNLIYTLIDKAQRWLFCKEENAVESSKAINAQRESPMSGKENIVWFPPDFGRKHRRGNHKDPVAA